MLIRISRIRFVANFYPRAYDYWTARICYVTCKVIADRNLYVIIIIASDNPKNVKMNWAY